MVRGRRGKGCNLRVLADFMGHNTIESLRPYVQVTATDLKAAHKRFHPRNHDAEHIQASPNNEVAGGMPKSDNGAWTSDM
jgi:hypothetical protein